MVVQTQGDTTGTYDLNSYGELLPYPSVTAEFEVSFAAGAFSGYVGFSDSHFPGASSVGCTFFYSTSSGRVYADSMDGSGVVGEYYETKTFTPDQHYILKIVLTETEAKYYIDTVLFATLTTHLPPIGTEGGLCHYRSWGTMHTYSGIATSAPTVAPVASFTVDTDIGGAPLTVAFTDTSTNTPTSGIGIGMMEQRTEPRRTQRMNFQILVYIM